MQARDEQELIERIRLGDTKAFAPLVEKHKDLVFTIVVRITSSRQDAEEVAKGVFLKAFRKFRSSKGDSKFSTWLYRIAFNEAVSFTRKKSLATVELDEKVTEIEEEEYGSHELMGLDHRGQKMLIEKTLAELDELENVIITLFYTEDSTVEEISHITGLSLSNVKVKLYRTRKKMHKIMGRMLRERAKTLN
jgi:RNA polymerase sigma-70 factor (ECF subfamily)